MPFRKRVSKLAGRFFAFISMRKAPRVENEETRPSTGDGNSRSDLLPPSRLPPSSRSGLPSTHADPITAQSIISMTSTHAELKTARSEANSRPTDIISSDDVHSDDHQSISDSVSSSDDPVHGAHSHQSVSQFSGARNVTVNGGNFYAAGGNVVIVRKKVGIESHEIADMLRETHAQTININTRLVEMIAGGLHLPPRISTGLLYVMDATGRRHTLTMDIAHSFESSLQNRVLRKYMDNGDCVLAVDDGRKPLQLRDEEGWMNTVQSDMTIVMSITMTQKVFYHRKKMKYQCLFCDYWNRLVGNNGKLLTICQLCGRRLQVRPPDTWIIEETPAIATNERDLIQNIYLKQALKFGDGSDSMDGPSNSPLVSTTSNSQEHAFITPESS
ncbi:hypothetical protein M413DRAFT_442249 [Hebeloma cylindrosporum]|uniref:Uncharacterized protein n=1 Tax=Hebeloma cylindrosporum TaxID=76867 RepID=A0A0C3CN73_HEBCY|nr:hypothetical protein M413DRAFT_442249 [Hebeloma cylindrosporum h7]